jgi:xanthine dehydrogenase YagT iron-sulfur-binding subunit
MTEENLHQEDPTQSSDLTGLDGDRRFFLKQTAVIAGLSLTPPAFFPALTVDPGPVGDAEKVDISIRINGKRKKLSIDPRITLLDLLREQLHLTGTKKGCDFGQCGACTVHVDGKRALACLSFATLLHGKSITTVEALSVGDRLHPMQEAFIKHDGFQCGFCTPGQLMSAIACVREKKTGSRTEISEYMSGNLCRCGAYPNIVDAIEDVNANGQKV